MKLTDFYALLDGVAPKKLSDEYCQRYDAYDNSGVLIDTGVEVEKALFALDLTQAALDKAREIGANLIVTHHPVVYGGKSRLSQDVPMDRHLIDCIRAGISVVSMHLNVDVAEGGIDDSLMSAVQRASGTKGGKAKMMHPLSVGGYGRAYTIDVCDVQELADSLGEVLGANRVQVYAQKEEISKVVSCCGAGADEGAIAFAKAEGADLLVSSDFKHHVIVAALEEGLSVIAPTHYATENYGFKKYFEKISKAAAVPCVYHEDKWLL
ncbi:MAG: Nif3-like dinuclear metal center hexameric protein [Clostridia bacterium]|nr:Nif3-like dinuclear metal center hexameric protein [Clostridia bacterium]